MASLYLATAENSCELRDVWSCPDVKRYPFLGQPELEFSGVEAHAGGGAGEPLNSVIGGLLPMALCGRTSL